MTGGPSAVSVRAQYARNLNERITITGYRGTGTGRVLNTAINVRSRMSGFTPNELTDLIVQGDSKLIVLASDLDEQGWSGGLVRGDKIVSVGGKEATVMSSDVNSRNVGMTLVCYEVVVRG